jgi:hypothetical protein
MINPVLEKIYQEIFEPIKDKSIEYVQNKAYELGKF